MPNIDNIIAKLDNKLSIQNNIQTTITLVLRYWQAYRFSNSPSDRAMLQRANTTALTAHRRNIANIELYCLTIFTSIEVGNFDTANEMLDKAVSYKSFLKTNEPMYYGILCFLYAYLEIHQKRTRSAKKHWRNLTDHIKNSEKSHHHLVMLGLLHLASREYPDAYDLLTEAYLQGCNNIFLHEGLFRYYNKTARSPQCTGLLSTLTYAAARGAEIESIAAKYPDELSAAVKMNLHGGIRLYEASNYPHILRDICNRHIKTEDYTPYAYRFYKDAEQKQIYVKGLYNALIQSAYKNKVETINHYPMSQFLIDNGGIPQDESLAIYICHLILTDEKLTDLTMNHHDKILDLAEACLEKQITTREAGSLYYFYWKTNITRNKQGDKVDRAERFLSSNLTKFKLIPSPQSATRYVYVTEPEKRGMAVYDTQDGLTIEACGQNISYTCLGIAKRTVLDEKLAIKRMISQANPELYMYFFDKGDRRFHVLAYLTNHFLQNPTEEAIPILEAILEDKGIKKGYRMRILVTLGKLYYNLSNFDQALSCYGEVDEDELDDNFIRQILNVYMQTGETKRAVGLLVKKHSFVEDEILYEAVLQLLEKQTDENFQLAEISYKLIISGYFHENLLTLVLEYFSASYTELLTLSKALPKPHPDLDSKLLSTAIWMAKWEPRPQQAFMRLLNGNNNQLITDFIEFATFEMFSNFSKPEYDVLDILEKWYIERDPGNILLAWGLSGVYLKHNITTFNSEKVLAKSLDALESEGILFPIFKEKAPGQLPFIAKHLSFLHRCLPNKDCWLYYHINGKTTAIPMQYVKYGIYVACVPVFYNEEVTYYFSEEMKSGSITTREETIKNDTALIHSSIDPFFDINNAVIKHHQFKYDEAETIISGLAQEVQAVRSKLL